MDGLKAQSEKSTSLSPSCDPTPLDTSSIGLTRRASTGSEFGPRREGEGVSSISARSLNEESAFEDPELRNTFRSDMEEGCIATHNQEGGRSNTLGLNVGSGSFPPSPSNISQSPTNMQIDSSTPGLPEAIQDIRELEAEKEELELKLVNLQEEFKVKERELLQDLEGERKVTKEVELERDGLKDKIKELERKLEMAKPFDSTNLDKMGQEPKVAMLEKQVIELTKKLSRRPENIKHSLVGGKGNYSRSEMLEMQGSKLAKLSEKNVERDQVLPREINASEACKEVSSLFLPSCFLFSLILFACFPDAYSSRSLRT